MRKISLLLITLFAGCLHSFSQNENNVITDNTSADGNVRYIGVKDLTLYQDISNDYKINSAILLFSCTKYKEEEPLFTLSVSITQNHYMIVRKGRKMLIKLDNDKVIELENKEDKESEYETYGKMIMLSYKIPVEYIKEIQSQKILKMRIDTEEGYMDLRLGNNDVAAYISNGYESMIGRLSKSKNIYDGF